VGAAKQERDSAVQWASSRRGLRRAERLFGDEVVAVRTQRLAFGG